MAYQTAKAAWIYHRARRDLAPSLFLRLGEIKGGENLRHACWMRLLPVDRKRAGGSSHRRSGCRWMNPPWSWICQTPVAALCSASYRRLKKAAAGGAKLTPATDFDGLRESLAMATELDVDGLHLDLTRAPRRGWRRRNKRPPTCCYPWERSTAATLWRADLYSKLAVFRGYCQPALGRIV
jgi:hypothetical protein